jgi:hypothetical protein
MVNAADVETVRTEFYRIYIADDGSTEQQQNARRQAFYRSVAKAQAANLIGANVTDTRRLIWVTEGQPIAATTAFA